MRKFNYSVRGDAFVNRKNVHFADYRHFNTVEIPATIRSISQTFNLLQYYRYSTSDKYVEAHLDYRTPFLFLKFLPFFSNRMFMTEGLRLSYLYTPHMKNYTELGYYFNFIVNAGIFVGFENYKYRSWGVTVSAPLKNVVMNK